MVDLAPRIVAIDYGKKRVGVAMADPLRLFAQPHGTFPPNEVIDALRVIDMRDGIACIVVGWPYELDGTEGPSTRFVEPFFHRLRRVFKRAEVVKWDERYTSHEARQRILRAGIGRKGRREKERIDANAAAVLLQDYLDAHPSES
ncbi:MAG: Holliday junction resolvase RuvX [Bacteroidota bacterium]